MNDFDKVRKEMGVLSEAKDPAMLNSKFVKLIHMLEDIDTALWDIGNQKDSDLDKLAKLKQDYVKHAKKLIYVAMKNRGR